jgi:hypothetical protein
LGQLFGHLLSHFGVAECRWICCGYLLQRDGVAVDAQQLLARCRGLECKPKDASRQGDSQMKSWISFHKDA